MNGDLGGHTWEEHTYLPCRQLLLKSRLTEDARFLADQARQGSGTSR